MARRPAAARLTRHAGIHGELQRSGRAPPGPKADCNSRSTAISKARNSALLRPRTQSDYIKQVKLIDQEFGDFPIKALAARKSRGVFMDWRDKLAIRSARQADYAWTVLARILSWAKDRGKATVNPCERGGRLYNGTGVDFVWTLEDEAAFLASAPRHLHLPLLLGLWTGSGRATSCGRLGRLMTAPKSG